MLEKIKTSIPRSVYEILVNDAKDFNILHKDNSINFNSFLNMLINNYYLSFSNSLEALNKELLKALKDLKEEFRLDVLKKIHKIYSEDSDFDSKKQESIVISFKPTKLTLRACLYIENVLKQNESLASYYRRMLISYTKKIKNEREKIIFKDNYNLLVKSINEKVKACLVLTSQVKYNPASIFTIAANKDEFYNYILLEANNNTYTIRLSNINEVILLNDKAEFNKDSLTIFNKQIKYGLQYPVSKKEDNPVVVKLTKKGIKLFNNLYLYRPIPDKIEEDIYTFNAPYAQILQYFKRFGDDALIISPACLTNTMANFYYFANKTYKKLRTKEKIEE